MKHPRRKEEINSRALPTGSGSNGSRESDCSRRQKRVSSPPSSLSLPFSSTFLSWYPECVVDSRVPTYRRLPWDRSKEKEKGIGHEESDLNAREFRLVMNLAMIFERFEKSMIVVFDREYLEGIWLIDRKWKYEIDVGE